MFDNITIISGGQSGVDRAALFFAYKNHINISGWCPSGRRAEDGKIPVIYKLKETETTRYSERTKLNVRDSDGTLIIYDSLIDPGTRLTIDEAIKLNKPYYLVNLAKANFSVYTFTISWLVKTKIKVLNIAGPRESSHEGIYLKTLKFLENLKDHSDDFVA